MFRVYRVCQRKKLVWTRTQTLQLQLQRDSNSLSFSFTTSINVNSSSSYHYPKHMEKSISMTEDVRVPQIDYRKLQLPTSPDRCAILIACGSFSPITYLHLRIFENARNYLMYETKTYDILGGFISPVHDKYGKKSLIPADRRVQMAELATLDSDWIAVSRWEVLQPAWSRTFQVLRSLETKVSDYINANLQSRVIERDSVANGSGLGGDSMHSSGNGNNGEASVNADGKVTLGTVNVLPILLCGADMIQSTHVKDLWLDNDLHAIFGRFGVAVCDRIDVNLLEIIRTHPILSLYSNRIHIIPSTITNNISSTAVRSLLQRQLSVKYLIPEAVREFIEKNELYGWKSRNSQIPCTIEMNQLPISDSIK